MKQEILAAKADSQCNGTIFLVGGSSGGTHSLWTALDPNPTVPGWSSAAFPKAVVSLSGVFDLPLRTPTPPPQFVNDVQIYTNTIDRFIGLEFQYSVSPIALVVPYATNQTAPARLYATDGDPVPWQQSFEMYNALQAQSVDVIYYKITDSNLHAFNYWHTINTNTGTCVNAEVIAFLNAHR